jgi:hypothetical protein
MADSTPPHRRPLPNRRRAETHDLAIDGMRLTATVGFTSAVAVLEAGASGSAPPVWAWRSTA